MRKFSMHFLYNLSISLAFLACYEVVELVKKCDGEKKRWTFSWAGVVRHCGCLHLVPFILGGLLILLLCFLWYAFWMAHVVVVRVALFKIFLVKWNGITQSVHAINVKHNQMAPVVLQSVLDPPSCYLLWRRAWHYYVHSAPKQSKKILSSLSLRGSM